jgi:trehalose synthase-fused probable maltokinase
VTVGTSIDAEALGRWLVGQRFFGSKSREPTGFTLVDAHELDERLVLTLLEVAYADGDPELYQLPIARSGTYDALAEPAAARRLLAAVAANEAAGDWSFHAVGPELGAAPEPLRPIGVEQSNSSTVFGDELILKVYRRIEPGPNPEIELLRFLTEQGFENIARLRGWYERAGTSLGVLQEFVAGAGDGWDVVLDAIGTDGGEAILVEVDRLGEATARMHSALGTPSGDPDFDPAQPDAATLQTELAAIDAEIERVFADLPAGEALDPIRGRGQDLRAHLRTLAEAGEGGLLTRTHGDYHLGQTLLTDRGWIILDFEGEPARSVDERREKRSPLRDVAGMLRSFAYAAEAAGLQRGTPAPEGWEGRARRAYLDAYFASVDPRLLPSGKAGRDALLQIFELEKAVYELRYELNNRPDWVRIPVAGIARLLEAPTA